MPELVSAQAVAVTGGYRHLPSWQSSQVFFLSFFLHMGGSGNGGVKHYGCWLPCLGPALLNGGGLFCILSGGTRPWPHGGGVDQPERHGDLLDQATTEIY